MPGTVFDLAKLNSVPCMFTPALSVGQRVDKTDCLACIESRTDMYIVNNCANDLDRTKNNSVKSASYVLKMFLS